MMETTHEKLSVHAGFPEEKICEPAPCPPALFEYTWYAILAYAILGQAWGLVIPSVGGALLAVLAVACFISVGEQISRVYAPVALALCTGISVIAVQFFFYSARALEEGTVFIGWLCTLLIVQALSLRPRFLHRFALVAFAIGLGVLPYIQMTGDGQTVRAGASGTGLANSNALGMWFGFCTVYFVFLGLQARNLILRTASWSMGLGCLFMVTFTVSRAPLLGIVLACVVGLRSALKRSFVPVVSLVFLMWMVYESGVFQQTIDIYMVRGTEETGRGQVWPVALQRIFDSPWTGVGFENIRSQTAYNRRIYPHNALLYIGLAAGSIPLMFFLGYLARVGKGAFHIMQRVHAGEAEILPPLLTFALVETLTLDTAFMSPWVVVVFGLAAVKRTALLET